MSIKVTSQQLLVLFDIAKTAMNQKNGFAGYSNEEIMKLLNQIISQQDNDELLYLDENIPEFKHNQLNNIVETETNDGDVTDFWED